MLLILVWGIRLDSGIDEPIEGICSRRGGLGRLRWCNFPSGIWGQGDIEL